MSNQTATSQIGHLSFFNLFGIFICIVLCIMFIILGGHTLKYIKAFACKIKIIVNKAEDKNVQIKDINNQLNEKANRSQAYQQMELVYKNEIKKSRSLHFQMIVRNLIAKYDHLLYYPFRDRVLEQYDLLKPKTTFYTLLFICSCCIAWMTTIFLSAILQNTYSNAALIPVGTFIGLTIAISIISSILNLVSTNRLFRIYLKNVKNAFKVNYGHRFLALDEGLKDYEPENSMEEEELFKHQDMLKNPGINDEEGDFNGTKTLNFGTSDQTQRTLMREETHMNSTRKLLGEEFEKSDRVNLRPDQSVIEEGKEDEDVEEDPKANNNAQHPHQVKVWTRGKALRDIFDLQVGIEGVEDADSEEKYIFIEDKHAIGDIDLLDNQADKSDNQQNINTFIILFIIFTIATAICCYLNYSFHKALAEAVFYMFIGSFFGDILICRPLILLLLAYLKFQNAKKKGYAKIDYKDPNDIHRLLNYAIKDMFVTRKRMKEEFEQRSHRGSLVNNSHLSLSKTKGKWNESSDQMIGGDCQTQNGIDRHDTSMKQLADFNDGKEDECAQEIPDKRDDDLDGPKIPSQNLHTGFHPTEYARPKIENDQKNHFEKTQTLSYNVQIPLLTNLSNELREKENAQFQEILSKKQLNDSLADYNLLLLRKIYDAYEERADKVLKNFRTDNNGVLRKRYMVPILNPNYDYEKLLQEMQEAGKGAAKDRVEEESVHLDGVTVCEDFEKELMEAVIQEASDDLCQKKIVRQKIDKFGNPVDENKLKEGIMKACPLPAFEKIEHEVEENVEEDDEEARKRKLLETLRQKLANGEQLSAEEQAMLEQLENERLQELERLINQMMSKGYKNLTDEEKLQLIGYQKERAHIMLDQLKRKQKLTKEDKLKIKQLEDELKRLELEELMLKEKLYGLTDEELIRLNQLEQERLTEINKRIAELQKKGWDKLTDQEKLELLSLQQEALNIELDQLKRKKPPLSEKDLQRMKEIEDELKKKQLEELMLKQKLGLLTAEEQQKLEDLQNHFQEEERKQQEAEALRIQAEEEALRQQKEEEEQALRLKEINEIEELRKKLLAGEITEEELARLRELENKYQLEHCKDPFEEQKKLEEEGELEEGDDLMHSRITDQDNFSELPPVQVMNNLTKTQSEDQKLQDIQENDANTLSKDNQLQEQSNLQEQQQEQDQLEKQGENEKQQQMKNQMSEQQRLEQERLEQESQEKLKNQDQEVKDSEANLENQDQNSKVLKQQQLLQQQQEQENQNEGLLQNQEDNVNNNIDSTSINVFAQNPLNNEQSDLEDQKAADSADDQEQLMSRLGSRKQERINQQLKEQGVDDEDFIKMNTSNKNLIDNDLGFNHDDLELGQINALDGANEEESIYSHKTTTILDEEKVSFMHIEHLPNQESGSDDSFAEQDMVYYNKDDLTNYSKGLGLNKVRVRNPGQYFSENDLQEVMENDYSENESIGGRSGRSGRSLDHTGQRRGYGRGHLSHRDLQVQGHEDLIDGRVKVDSWNLNYKGKKKKLKKKKLNNNNLKKMQDLQEIYGVDAKTLAGLSKGRLPRQLLASGKLKADDPIGHNSRMMSDNSFRSTQNTFMNKLSQTPGHNLKQSINDAQSNIFSFNGFGTRQNWNDTALKGGPMDSRNYGVSQKDSRMSNKKQPFNGMKKLTSTQQNFGNKPDFNAGRGYGYPEEESKSLNSGSRGRSLNKNYRSKQGFNNNIKTGKGKKAKRQQHEIISDGMDSHTESDEAVDDKGAWFQRRNGPFDFNGRRGSDGGMNDNLDHSESEEANNNDNPNFDGNEFMFNKRRDQSSAMGKKSKGKLQKDYDFIGGRGSGNESDEAEDLEAQQVTAKKGRKGLKESTTNKKGKNNGFMRGESDDRQDSEEENDGGYVNFQRNNLNDSNINRSRSNNKRNISNSKPPLSGRSDPFTSGKKNNRNNSEMNRVFRNMNNDSDSNQERMFRGVNGKFRGQYSEISDNEHQMRASNYSSIHHESDNDIFSSSKKRGQLNRNLLGSSGRNSDPNLLNPNSSKKQGRRRDRANDLDMSDDYIVGPESNHSSLKKRPLGSKRGSHQDDDRYLLVQRERQIVEDIESENSQAYGRLAKKRKIRKAAHSENPRDAQARRFQELQNQRLRRKKEQAEAALFAQGDDLESGKAKLKKKKIKKDWVRKEINYWLDYNSPYAEYLVARFREWSPNPNRIRGPSANSQRNSNPLSNKYNQLMSVYSKNNVSRGSSKMNSRSRERKIIPSNNGIIEPLNLLNVASQQRLGDNLNHQPTQLNDQQEDVNTLFVNDYEEEP